MNFYSIDALKAHINSQLKEHIQENCILLNTPDHVNIGDQLIWQGEVDFLKSQNIIPKYTSSLFSFDWRNLPKDTLIMLHGGGNFGDVWDDHQEFRLKVVQKYKDNKILIFPQSVQYQNKDNLLKDAELFSSHPNLVICARDEYSYNLLTKYFKNTIIMLPDMALCSSYKNLTNEKTNRKLLLKRTDREVPTTIEFNNYSGFEIKDWPSYDKTINNFILSILERINRVLTKVVFKILFKNKQGDTTFGFGVVRDKKQLINQGTDFISNYDLVVTTRLHGHILSILMDVPSIMIDNNYGKNSRFFNTWLKNIPNNWIVSSKSELDQALSEYQKRL